MAFAMGVSHPLTPACTAQGPASPHEGSSLKKQNGSKALLGLPTTHPEAKPNTDEPPQRCEALSQHAGASVLAQRPTENVRMFPGNQKYE